MVEDHASTPDSSNPSSSTQAVRVQPPAEVVAILVAFEVRPAAFLTDEVAREIRRAVPDRQSLARESQRGAWAEQIAFAFQTHRVAGGGPWGTHFQPWMSATNPDGTAYYSPDLAEVDSEVLAHWAARAKEAKHPVLVARYADLVWDVTQVVTKSKRGRDAIE